MHGSLQDLNQTKWFKFRRDALNLKDHNLLVDRYYLSYITKIPHSYSWRDTEQTYAFEMLHKNSHESQFEKFT